MENDDKLLPLSGIQHFSFCQRQWALIHIEQQWQENLRTTEGHLMHQRAHDARLRERRGNVLTLHELSICSHALGLSGKCDVVEFHLSANGVFIQGEEGLWQPYPVEYKHGEPKEINADKLQLCAQAMCLEEMLCCSVPCGALFYGETRRRLPVEFDSELRQELTDLCLQMHQLYERGYTPKVKPSKSCNACSLKDLCLPKLMRHGSPSDYIKSHIVEEVEL